MISITLPDNSAATPFLVKFYSGGPTYEYELLNYESYFDTVNGAIQDDFLYDLYEGSGCIPGLYSFNLSDLPDGSYTLTKIEYNGLIIYFCTIGTVSYFTDLTNHFITFFITNKTHIGTLFSEFLPKANLSDTALDIQIDGKTLHLNSTIPTLEVT